MNEFVNKTKQNKIKYQTKKMTITRQKDEINMKKI
jgi:hypothetical protein